MSRKDNLLAAIGNVLSEPPQRPASSRTGSVRSTLQRTLDQVQSSIQGLTVNEQPDQLFAAPHPSERPARSGVVTHRPGTEQAVDGDELPGYSRRAPPVKLPGQAESSVPIKTHEYATKSGKLELSLVSTGDRAYPVYVSGLLDNIAGEITLRLEKEEAYNQIRVRVKCVARTVSFRAQGSGRHPQGEELILLEMGRDLWTAPTMGTKETTTLAAGVHAWKFSFQLPDQLPMRFEDRSMPLPPSFVFNVTDFGARELEVAAIRYYVKVRCRFCIKLTLQVTAARPGLFKTNERLFAPVVFLCRQDRAEMSALRQIALAEGQPPPGPSEDPGGWTGRKARSEVKRGVVNARKAQFDAVILTPNPAIFDKHTALTFALKIRSSDPTITTDFPPNSIEAYLVDRLIVQAGGIPGVHERILARATFAADGPPQGERLERTDQDGMVWVKRVRGEIAIPSVAPSFRTPTLANTYALVVRVGCPGARNDIIVSVPVSIIAAPPPVRIDQAIAESRPVEDAPLSPAYDMDLPPSYFQATGAGDND